MFGPMYSQLMKARLGVGKPMEGYGGFQPQATLPAPSPWLHQGGPRQTPFEPRPEGGTMPIESPWSPRQTPYEPRPEGGEAPWNPRQTGYEPRPQGGEPMTPKMPGGMGGMKNPWQRY